MLVMTMVAQAYAGPVVDVDASARGWVESCDLGGVSARVGYILPVAFLEVRPELTLGAFGGDATGGCGGGVDALGGARLGFAPGRTLPLAVGLYGRAGLATESPAVEYGAYADVVLVKRLELGVHAGFDQGYLGRGWADVGFEAGWRF